VDQACSLGREDVLMLVAAELVIALVIAKIQPNKKEYKIILRLNDQKKID
jgi:hypothetical protein